MAASFSPLHYTEPNLTGAALQRSSAKPAKSVRPGTGASFISSSTVGPASSLEASRPVTPASTWSIGDASWHSRSPGLRGGWDPAHAAAVRDAARAAAPSPTAARELGRGQHDAPKQEHEQGIVHKTPSFGFGGKDGTTQFGVGDSNAGVGIAGRPIGTISRAEAEARRQLVEFQGQVDGIRHAVSKAKDANAPPGEIDGMLAVAVKSERLFRGRDAVLQAVLAELEAARMKLQNAESIIKEREAEIRELRSEMQEVHTASRQRVDLASGTLQSRALELETLRSQVREAQTTHQHQQELLRAKDAELSSMRAELHDVRASKKIPPSELSRGMGADANDKRMEARAAQLEVALAAVNAKWMQLEETNNRLRLELQEANERNLGNGRVPSYMDSISGRGIDEPALSPVRPRSARSLRLRQEVLTARDPGNP